MDFLRDVAKTAVDAANNRSSQNSNVTGSQNSNVNGNNGLGFATGNSAVDGVLGNLNGALGGGKQGEAKEGAYTIILLLTPIVINCVLSFCIHS
jgi:hypothetical protein